MSVKTTRFVQIWHASTELRPTVADLLKYMEENDIPMTAEITYDELDGPLLEWDTEE